MYGLYRNGHSVAAVSKLYLTLTEMIMQSLKSYDASPMPNVTIKAFRHERTYRPTLNVENCKFMRRITGWPPRFQKSSVHFRTYHPYINPYISVQFRTFLYI